MQFMQLGTRLIGRIRLNENGTFVIIMSSRYAMCNESVIRKDLGQSCKKVVVRYPVPSSSVPEQVIPYFAYFRRLP